MAASVPVDKTESVHNFGHLFTIKQFPSEKLLASSLLEEAIKNLEEP
jgi:hypothetical protein